MNHKELANMLYQAEKETKQIYKISDSFPQMTIDDAYKIQLENVQKRCAQGEMPIGMKIGLTSKGMQNLLGVNEPDYGHLFDNMLLLEGETLPVSQLIQPKVEGELAFLLKKDLKGPGVTVAQVYNATKYIAPAIEIVDSRIKDWKINLMDTVADNGSSARLVLGSNVTPIHKVDMRLTGMTLEKNGELLNSGTTAEVLGNPAAAVAWLANALSRYDIVLKKGSIVLSGAVTAAAEAKAGDVFTVSFQNMGSVSVKFID